MAPTSLRAKPKAFLRTNKTSPQPILLSPAPQFLLQPNRTALRQCFPAQVMLLPGYLPTTFFFPYCPSQTPSAFLSVPVMGWSIYFPSFSYVPSVVGYFPRMMRLFGEFLLLQRATAGREASVCSSRHQAPVGGCCSGTASGAAGVHPVLLGRQVF